MELTQNLRRQLQRPERSGSYLEWPFAILRLNKTDEQYIEKETDKIATLHFKEGISEAAILSLVKPWLMAAKAAEEWSPKSPEEKVTELVRDLTGPAAIERPDDEDIHARLCYGAGGRHAFTVFACDPVWHNNPGVARATPSAVRVGEELLEGWEDVVVEVIEEFIEPLEDPTGDNDLTGREQMMLATYVAAERTEEFEPVMAEVHGKGKVAAFRRENGEEIGLRFRRLHGALGKCDAENRWIKLDKGLVTCSHSPFDDLPDFGEDYPFMRTLQVALHELGHAACDHAGASEGYGDGYSWQHELEAERYVMDHAENEIEAEAFEAWALDNLRAKHGA